MAEIVPPTTRPLGTLSRTVNGDQVSRTFAFAATDGKPFLRMVFDNPAPPPDPNPPVVSNVTPAAGTALTPDSTVGFDLTDDVEILAAFVYVIYPDLGEAEAVHDGATFLPRFVGLSSRSTIANGFRYTLRRSGGWKSTNIDVRVRALDAAGNESS